MKRNCFRKEMSVLENGDLVKLKDATVTEDAVTGKYELCFKFEIDDSFEPALKDFCTKFGYNPLQYVSYSACQLINDILCETKSQLDKQNLKEMEKKSDDQGKN